MKRWTGSPWWLLGILIVVLFAAESMMVLGMHFFDLFGHHTGPFSQGSITSLLDALFMTVIAVPLVYLLLVRPLNNEMDRRRNLEENIALFRETIDQSPDGIFVVNPENAEILDVNKTAQEMLGYTREDLTGKRVQEINLSFDDELDWDSFKKRVRDEGPITVEAQHETRKGETIPVQVKVDRVETGDETRHLAIARDLTEKKELERRHERRRRRFEAIFNSTFSLVGLIRTNGELVEVNETALEMVDEEYGNLQGEPFWETPWWDHSETVQQQLRDGIQRASEGEFVRFETTHETAEGETTHVDVSLNPIETDEDTVDFIVAEGRIIDHQKQLQDDLKSQRDFLETIVNSAPNPIFVKNWDGEFELVNEAMAEFLGVDREKVVGQTEADFLTDEAEVDRVYEDDRRVMRSGEPLDIPEERFQHPGTGETVYFSTVKVPLDLDNPPEQRRVLGIATDITEQKQARDKLRRQADFLEAINDRMPGVAFQFRVGPDGEYSFPYLSEGFEELSGVSVEEARNDFESTLRHVPDDEVNELVESIEQAVKNMETWRKEYRYRFPDGSETWVLGSSTPEERDDGSIVFSGVMIDITTRKKLSREQQRLNEIIEATPDFVGTALPSGEVQFLNQSFRDRFDIGQETPASEYHVTDFYPEDEGERIVNEALPAARENGTWTGETTLRTPDGEDIPVSEVIIAHHDNRGEVSYFSTVIRDISREKEIQERLEQSEQRFRQMSEAVNEIFWMFDEEFSELHYVTEDKYKDIWGRDAGELYEDATDFIAGVNPDDRENVRMAMERLMDGREVSIECRVNPREDYERWVQIEGFPLWGDEGDIERLTGTTRDITERKRAEEKLRESEQRFRQMAENIEEVFWIADPRPSGGVEYVSPAYEEIWGRSREELYENPDQWQEAIVPEDRERVREASEDQTEPVIYDIEYRIETPEGERRWIRDRAFPVEDDDGDVTRITGLAEDITEMKRVQESLEASLREKNTLLQEVHHRVKNNMQIITSLLQMQAREIDDERIDRLVAQSQQRVRSMALIHEKLYQSDDIARIGYDQYIRELVEGVLSSRVNPGTEVVAEFDLDSGAKLTIDEAIPCGLIISELVTNALQHAFEGRDSGTISVSFEEEPEEYALVVEDDGVGYDQGDDESMGQSLIEALAEDQLDGTLTFSTASEEGGTRCHLSFPKETNDSTESLPTES